MAKAMALALAFVARRQKRWCALVGWSAAGQRRVLALPPGAWDEVALFDWLEGFFGGGTEPPLGEMAAIYAATGAPAGKTDAILITDGDVYVDPDVVATFLQWKAASRTRMITFAIDSAGESLRPFSDEVHAVKTLDPSSEAVGATLAI
jgi:uncharacterized protein with von Willebrand factor type A (vWA) domain